MKTMHLLAPSEDRHAIESHIQMIHTRFYPNKDNKILFILDMTEEEVTYYTLKYGKDCIWVR